MDISSGGSTTVKKPSPHEFDLFLPWACNQLSISAAIYITRITQSDYVSASGQSDRSKKRKRLSKAGVDSDDRNLLIPSIYELPESSIQIYTIYDSSNNLVQLRFEKNKIIPRLVFKVIDLIIKYYPYLNTITIDRGLDKTTLYDICKFLPYCHITDICLDNTFLAEANYYVLLEEASNLRNLSLSRCSITDVVIEPIAALLHYSLSGSKSLCILNLATNNITDLGAKYLADALRSNRRLNYLNLADNKLTDEGAKQLLNSLQSFSLTFAELLASRTRHMAYFKEKSEMVQRIIVELRTAEMERRPSRRKVAKPVQLPKKKGLEKEGSVKSLADPRSITNMDHTFYEKACVIAENKLGEFRDPFDEDNTDMIGCITYCLGNNALNYINLAYNNLTYETVKTLLLVLKHQKLKGRRPKGLVNISIEGNPLPVHCKEMTLIDDILETGLMTQSRRYSMLKKRGSAKSPAPSH